MFVLVASSLPIRRIELSSPRAVFETRDSFLRHFEEPNGGSEAGAVKMGRDGFANLSEPGGRERDGARARTAQREAQESGHLWHGEHIRKSGDEVLSIALVQAIPHRFPNQLIPPR